jgi:DNA-binding MarR family transcriptional regulator
LFRKGDEKMSEKATEVQKKLIFVGKKMRHSMKFNMEELGLTMSQGMIVGMLIHEGKAKIGQISKKMNLSNATVSGIVDRLENQGKVHRTRSESDRRAVYVEVDREFKVMLKEKHDSLNQKLIEPLFHASDEELDKIIEGLDILERLLGGKDEC